MSFSPVAFIAPNYRDYKNYWLKFYEPSTTTPKAISLDGEGLTQVAKLQLNIDGFVVSAGGAIVMPYVNSSYDGYLFPTEAEADNNDTANAIRVADDITGVNGAVLANSVVGKFDTLQDAIDEESTLLIYDGASLYIAGRNTKGDGGGAMWDVVDGSTVTANGFDVVACAAIPTLALVLRVNSVLDASTFGAYNSATHSENTSVINHILSTYGKVTISGQYDIGTLTADFGTTISFTDKGRLTVATGETLTILGAIDADYDYWILDSIDSPTNFSDPDGLLGPAVTTTAPIIIGDVNDGYLNAGMGKKISVKWFGATGAGMKLDTYNDYFGQLTLPSDQFVNDTKPIRLAVTALAKDPKSGSLAGNYAGSNILYFPVGMYCVDEEIYVSGGTTIIGDTPIRPNRVTGLLQTNCDKNLLVLQSRGVGGLGGGGTSHVIKDMLLGYRPCSVSATSAVSTVKFVDNKFNLDTSFHNIRFSNSPTHGSCVLVDNKEARSYSDPLNPAWGYGLESGLLVSAHFYDCMFDVAQGRTIKVGENASTHFEIVDCQFFDQRDGFYVDETKTTNAPEGGETYLHAKGCDFQGCGSPNNSVSTYRTAISNDNSESSIIITDSVFRQFEVGVVAGGRIRMNKGRLLKIKDCNFNYNKSSSESYAFELDGYIKTLEISDNLLKRTHDSATATIRLGALLTGDMFRLSSNTFIANVGASNGQIFSSNPTIDYSAFAVIMNNTFSDSAREALFGNISNNMHIKNNFFTVPQTQRAISYDNYGMKTRQVSWGTAPPITGTFGQGAKVYNELPVAGGTVGWICVAAGTPGTWKAFGAISS